MPTNKNGCSQNTEDTSPFPKSQQELLILIHNSTQSQDLAALTDHCWHRNYFV